MASESIDEIVTIISNFLEKSLEQLYQIRREVRSCNQMQNRLEKWKDRTAKEIERYITNSEAIKFKESKFQQMTMHRSEDAALQEIVIFWHERIKDLQAELRMDPHGLLDPDKMKLENENLKGDLEFFKLIHPVINTSSKARFDKGEYADAVFAAFRSVDRRVSDHHETETGVQTSGKDAMMKAFGDNNPSILVGDLSSQSAKDMQEGYRFLFAGSMLAIRNPKAHEEVIVPRDLAVHLLFLASLEMHKLDEWRV